jgi:hypothetical protein
LNSLSRRPLPRASLPGLDVPAPPTLRLAFAPSHLQRARLEKRGGMGEFWRHICRAKRLDSASRLARIEHKFGESDGRHSVAWIVVDKSGAHCPCARRLPMPHEHPRGRKQKLSLVVRHQSFNLSTLQLSNLSTLQLSNFSTIQLFNFSTYFVGGVSLNIVTIIFS